MKTASAFTSIAAGLLAATALVSAAQAQANIKIGVVTPLSGAYEGEILRRTGTRTLQEAFERTRGL